MVRIVVAAAAVVVLTAVASVPHKPHEVISRAMGALDAHKLQAVGARTVFPSPTLLGTSLMLTKTLTGCGKGVCNMATTAVLCGPFGCDVRVEQEEE